MNFGQMQLEVFDLGVDPQTVKTKQVRNWINMAEAKTWAADDWPFRHVQTYSLPVLANNTQPVMPADFEAAEALFDSTQDQITYMAPREWRGWYENSTATGLADSYTVINGQIYVSPIPSVNQTLTLSYIRSVSHLNAAGTTVAGVMSLATDLPLFDVEFHYLLPLEAAIVAKQLKGDPTWQALVPQRDELLSSMRNALVAETEGERPMVAGMWPGSGDELWY